MRKQLTIPLKIDKGSLKEKLNELAKVLTEKKIVPNKEVLELFLNPRSIVLQWDVIEVPWQGYDHDLPEYCRKDVFKYRLLGSLEGIDERIIGFDFMYGIHLVTDRWVEYCNFIQVQLTEDAFADPEILKIPLLEGDYTKLSLLTDRIDHVIHHLNDSIIEQTNLKEMKNTKKNTEPKVLILTVHGEERGRSGLSQRGVREINNLSDKISPYLQGSKAKVMTNTLSRCQQSGEILAKKFSPTSKHVSDSSLDDYENSQSIQKIVDKIKGNGVIVSTPLVLNNFLKSKGYEGSLLSLGQGMILEGNNFTRI